MFSNRIALQIAAAADAAGISKTGMLALVEVETGGKPTEEDGRTPNFLFERHIFYRELTKAGKRRQLQAAVQAGLAIPKWSKATQYRDERNSSMRLALLQRAKNVDEDCALRSCSWGLPQIMGNECTEVGFSSAKEMVDYLTEHGVPGHIGVMIRFLKARRLVSAIERKDWPYVAFHYNGAGYRENQYDTKLEAADRKWQRLLPTLAGSESLQDPPEHELSRDEVKQIQVKLRLLGYTEVGMTDGKWGTRTTGAISAFQSHEGLTVNGHYDEATKSALSTATPRPVDPERLETTAEDLREDGSETVAGADGVATVGKIKVIGGSTVALGAAAEQASTALGGVQEAADKLGQARSVWESVQDLVHPLLGHPMIIVLGLAFVISGILVWRYAGRVIAARLGDHQDATHAGRVS